MKKCTVTCLNIRQHSLWISSSLILLMFSSCIQMHSIQGDMRQARDKEKGNFVQTKDGAILTGDEIKRRFPLFKRQYVEMDNGARVQMRDVEILQDDRAYYRRVNSELIPRIDKGNINTYLTFRTTQSYNGPSGMGGSPGGSWNTQSRPVYFIQKSDSGAIMLMEPKRLNEMVADYQPALDFMNEYFETKHKARIWSVVNTAAFLGGIALAATSIREDGSIKPIGFVGVGLTLGGLGNGFVNKFRKARNGRNMELAIDEYNRKR